MNLGAAGLQGFRGSFKADRAALLIYRYVPSPKAHPKLQPGASSVFRP